MKTILTIAHIVFSTLFIASLFAVMVGIACVNFDAPIGAYIVFIAMPSALVSGTIGRVADEELSKLKC